VSYAYLDARIDRFDVTPGSIYDQAANPLSPFRVGDNIAGLFTMPNAPKHSIGVSGDYTFLHFGSASVTAHADYRWQGATRTLLAGKGIPGRDFTKQPSYGVLNGRLTVDGEIGERGSSLSASLWVKNALDKKYISSQGPSGPAFGTFNGLNIGTAFGAAGFAKTGLETWGEPATFGISVSYKY
jgi:iron complex outermembrane recepter protein